MTTKLSGPQPLDATTAAPGRGGRLIVGGVDLSGACTDWSLHTTPEGVTATVTLLIDPERITITNSPPSPRVLREA